MSAGSTTHLDPDGRRTALIADVREGLGSRPHTLPPKYFYDARGSELFDEITRLEEYYPTRAEREILVDHAEEITRLTDAATMIELGSGTSEKTRLLLDAFHHHGTLRRFVPLDVDPVVLEQAAEQLRTEHPGLDIVPVVADFEHHLDTLPVEGPRLVAFLGSTIGNFEPDARGRFLAEVGAMIGPEDFFLLGTDLVKDPARLVAAYDDGAGVTADFNRNVLRVLNAELGADFDPDAFEHVAVWDPRCEWIEMRLASSVAQTVSVPGADLVLHLQSGDEIRTELSAKFRRERVADELDAAGLELRRWWSDAAGDFGLSLSRARR